MCGRRSGRIELRATDAFAVPSRVLLHRAPSPPSVGTTVHFQGRGRLTAPTHLGAKPSADPRDLFGREAREVTLTKTFGSPWRGPPSVAIAGTRTRSGLHVPGSRRPCGRDLD